MNHPFGRVPASGLRACRVCGCTEFDACVINGRACHWVEEDLCSACEGIRDNADELAARIVEGRPPMRLRSRLALSALGTAVMLGVVAATMTVLL